jgi:D-proline reductase (dithiol) PrdB
VDVAVLVPVRPVCCRPTGLVRQVIEASGIATVSLSTAPEFTASLGARRIAGIEFPFGRPLGLPGNRPGQRAVLQPR